MKRMIRQPKRQSQVRSMQQASAHSIQRSGLLGPLVALVVMIALAIGVCLLGTSALGGGAPFSGVSLAWADDTNASSGSDNAGGSDSTAGSANAGGSDNADTSDNAGSSDNPDNSNRVYVNQLSDGSFLYDTSIADLSQADSYYEGQTVLVKGEVVGDRINDESNGDYCWITLQDDADTPSTVAVYMSKEQSNVIDTYGKYGTEGTQLQVRGTYHLECPIHQGLSDIHAEEVSALQEGHKVSMDPHMGVWIAAIMVCLVGVGLMALYHVRRERLR